MPDKASKKASGSKRKKDQRGILALAGVCAEDATDLEKWKKGIYANRRKQSLRTFKV